MRSGTVMNPWMPAVFIVTTAFFTIWTFYLFTDTVAHDRVSSYLVASFLGKVNRTSAGHQVQIAAGHYLPENDIDIIQYEDLVLAYLEGENLEWKLHDLPFTEAATVAFNNFRQAAELANL